MLMLNLAIILLLILLNGFFAMAEIALISARPGRLQPLADGGSKGAEAAIELKGDPSRLLATVQMGITVIAVLSGTFGQATLGQALQGYFAGFPAVAQYAHAIAMALVVLGISYLSLILGELVPKRVALIYPEGISAALARLMRSIATVGAPVEWLLSTTTDLILALLPLRRAPAGVTDEEIAFLLREGVAAGHIAAAETAIVEGALRLGERRVSGVMTPRMQVEFLDLDDSEEELRRQIRESSFSRFPVQQGPTHRLAGIVQVKDLYDAALAGQKFDLRAALRPPLYIPDTVTVLRALEMFKTSGEPMALVVDEYGDLEGVTTLTDIVEALIGEVSSGDGDDPRVVAREDGTFLMDGMIGFDELKDVLDIAHLPGDDADFHTLGGYLMGRLNRVPVVADRVVAGGFRFEVVAMDGRRVDRVLVTPAKGDG